MKKYLITLIVAASATIHAQDAGLESQLQGYWQPDVDKTVALATKANREMDPLSQAMMGKLVFEFQKDKMTVHGPPGFTCDSPPVPFEVKGEDKVAKSLTLSVGGKEMKVRFDKGQMALNDPENGWQFMGAQLPLPQWRPDWIGSHGSFASCTSRRYPPAPRLRE